MRDNDISILLNVSSTREQITRVLCRIAEDVLEEHSVEYEEPCSVYVVGTGYDFDEFGAVFAARPPITLEGVACFWTEKSPIVVNEDVYGIQQHFLEPVIGTRKRLLLLSQSMIADKMEVLTILSRVMPLVKPTYLTIACAAINSSVKAELEDFLQDYFEDGDLQIMGPDLAVDLRAARVRIARTLDDRPSRLVPIMSMWLFERRFGLKPDPEPKVVADYGR